MGQRFFMNSDFTAGPYLLLLLLRNWRTTDSFTILTIVNQLSKTELTDEEWKTKNATFLTHYANIRRDDSPKIEEKVNPTNTILQTQITWSRVQPSLLVTK